MSDITEEELAQIRAEVDAEFADELGEWDDNGPAMMASMVNDINNGADGK